MGLTPAPLPPAARPAGPRNPTPEQLEMEWIGRGDDLLFSEYRDWRRSHYANGLPFPPEGGSGVVRA